MNIVVLGAGAIGSLFGGLLSKNNNVVLIGRDEHVNSIRKNGLIIKGKTRFTRKINAVERCKDISFSPDLLLLTVKAYDTLKAIEEAKDILAPDTIVLSFQNGLTNIDYIKTVIPKHQIIAGSTTHGVQQISPGIIYHKGIGKTVIGELTNKRTQRIKRIAERFNESGIFVSISDYIEEAIWRKAIVNSCINPVTAIFHCRNGYLAKNPILTKVVKQICFESTNIANKKGFSFNTNEMIEFTMQVIDQTEQNFSSMLQSLKQGKPTEIDEINGTLASIGKTYHCPCSLNNLLTKIIKSM